MQDSPKSTKMLDNPRGYNPTRKSDNDESSFLAIIRETPSDKPIIGSGREYGRQELASGVGHTSSSIINKDYRSSVFQLNTIKEEDQHGSAKKGDDSPMKDSSRQLGRAGARSLDRLSILNENQQNSPKNERSQDKASGGA